MNKGILKLIAIIVFLVFGSSYIMAENGYDEYYMRQKILITSDKIREFEDDIENNRDIDLKKYAVNDIKYSNKLSDFMYEVSEGMFKTSRKMVKYLFKRLNNLVQDS